MTDPPTRSFEDVYQVQTSRILELEEEIKKLREDLLKAKKFIRLLKQEIKP